MMFFDKARIHQIHRSFSLTKLDFIQLIYHDIDVGLRVVFLSKLVLGGSELTNANPTLIVLGSCLALPVRLGPGYYSGEHEFDSYHLLRRPTAQLNDHSCSALRWNRS